MADNMYAQRHGKGRPLVGSGDLGGPSDVLADGPKRGAGRDAIASKARGCRQGRGQEHTVALRKLATAASRMGEKTTLLEGAPGQGAVNNNNTTKNRLAGGDAVSRQISSASSLFRVAAGGAGLIRRGDLWGESGHRHKGKGEALALSGGRDEAAAAGCGRAGGRVHDAVLAESTMRAEIRQPWCRHLSQSRRRRPHGPSRR